MTQQCLEYGQLLWSTQYHQLAMVEELCPAIPHSTEGLKLKTGSKTVDIVRAFLGVGSETFGLVSPGSACAQKLLCSLGSHTGSWHRSPYSNGALGHTHLGQALPLYTAQPCPAWKMLLRLHTLPGRFPVWAETLAQILTKSRSFRLHSHGSSPATLHSTAVPSTETAAETAQNARALPSLGRDLGLDVGKDFHTVMELWAILTWVKPGYSAQHSSAQHGDRC